MNSPDVAEDSSFQRKEWIFERCGWALLVVLAVAAGAGLFGGGPLAKATAVAPDHSFKVDYSRFARVQSPTVVTVTVLSAPKTGEPIRVLMSENYLRALTSSAITPSPHRTELGNGQVAFAFLSNGEVPATIRFTFESTAPGWANGTIRVGTGAGTGTDAIAIEQLFYP